MPVLTLPKNYSVYLKCMSPQNGIKHKIQYNKKKYRFNHGAVMYDQRSKPCAVPQLQESSPNITVYNVTHNLAYPTSTSGFKKSETATAGARTGI